MLTKSIVPVGWPCSLTECRPGHFIPLAYPDMLCFKSEYADKAFNVAGEYYCADPDLLVQSVDMIVEDEEL